MYFFWGGMVVLNWQTREHPSDNGPQGPACRYSSCPTLAYGIEYTIPIPTFFKFVYSFIYYLGEYVRYNHFDKGGSNLQVPRCRIHLHV